VPPGGRPAGRRALRVAGWYSAVLDHLAGIVVCVMPHQVWLAGRFGGVGVRVRSLRVAVLVVGGAPGLAGCLGVGRVRPVGQRGRRIVGWYSAVLDHLAGIVVGVLPQV
jgi:hypothetical protein